jgi:cytochrome c-type biogenesis protein CcmH/NrfG
LQGNRKTIMALWQSISWYIFGIAAAVVSFLVLIRRDTLILQQDRRRRIFAVVVLFILPIVVAVLMAPDRAVPNAALLPAQVASTAQPVTENSEWGFVNRVFPANHPPIGAADVSANAGMASARAEASAAELADTVQREPGNSAAWFALGQARRVARDFAAAAQAYESGLKLDGRNADAWADYADALASANGRSLQGKPAEAIKRALVLAPKHLKGLWLAASLEMEQQHYAQALEVWQTLRATLAAGSPDIAVIDSNIAEARQLASGKVP